MRTRSSCRASPISLPHSLPPCTTRRGRPLPTAPGSPPSAWTPSPAPSPLADTGLLDGLRATTHWRAAGLLAVTHPDIDVDPDVLHVDNGQLLTSAGAAAGMDLCLHTIRRDHGSAVAAADAARPQ